MTRGTTPSSQACAQLGASQSEAIVVNPISHFGSTHAPSGSGASCIAIGLESWGGTAGRSPEPMPSLRDVVLSELHIRALPRRCYPEGAEIIGANVLTRSIYFIVEGRVRLYRLSPAGDEVFYGEIEAGESLVAPPLADGARPTFAQAMADTTAEILSIPQFAKLMVESVVFNRALVSEMSKRIMQLDERLYEATALPMKVRLHAELLRLVSRQPDGTLSITPPPTHQDLALRIGSQREAVSKELARLSRLGIVRYSRSSIVFVDERALRQEIADWTE
jgi:CRP/FNR family transcriptional regulator, cyclic AMP receptor protein